MTTGLRDVHVHAADVVTEPTQSELDPPPHMSAQLSGAIEPRCTDPDLHRILAVHHGLARTMRLFGSLTSIDRKTRDQDRICLRATSQIAATAGFRIFRSREIA